METYLNGAGTGMERFQIPLPLPARRPAPSASNAVVPGASLRLSAPCLSGSATARATVTATLVFVLCATRSNVHGLVLYSRKCESV